MKKNLKRLSIFFLALIITCISSVTVLADTIYYDNGLLYTYLNNDEVTICGAAEGVTEVKIPYYINYRYVVDIRNRAFLDNAEITSVDFSNIAFLRRIGSFAFAGCINLDGEIVIPNTVTAMDTAAFQGCTSLDSVVFNASTGIVPNQCFSGCTSLSGVTLNDTVTEIGYYAFANCPSLTYIEIPKSVTSIAQSSFQNDTDITLGVYQDSFAHQFAVDNGYDFVLIDAPPEISVLLGDADDDGFVTIRDVTTIQRLLSYIYEDPDGMIALRGDIAGDGLDINDATLISRYLIDIELDYPINQTISRPVPTVE